MVAVATAGVLLRPVGFPSALRQLQGVHPKKSGSHHCGYVLCYNINVTDASIFTGFAST